MSSSHDQGGTNESRDQMVSHGPKNSSQNNQCGTSVPTGDWEELVFKIFSNPNRSTALLTHNFYCLIKAVCDRDKSSMSSRYTGLSHIQVPEQCVPKVCKIFNKTLLPPQKLDPYWLRLWPFSYSSHQLFCNEILRALISPTEWVFK